MKNIFLYFKKAKNNSSKGFTLAEILISLMILGVIASLTIPSLIQNTQKKEEVVKIQKGLSIINQAISTNYALTGEDLFYSDDNYATGDKLIYKLKSRLAITDIASNGWTTYFKTQDGLSFELVCDDSNSYNPENEISDNNWVCYVNIITKPVEYSAEEIIQNDDLLCGSNNCIGGPGHLTGYYEVFCNLDRCVASESVAAILNAADATKAE